MYYSQPEVQLRNRTLAFRVNYVRGGSLGKKLKENRDAAIFTQFVPAIGFTAWKTKT